MPLIHSYNNWNNWIFKSGMDSSVSSKWRAFLSLHKHQKTQWGTALHTLVFLWLPKGPCQLEKKSKTVLGITQWTPNKPSTSSHNSQATLQWSKRWSGLSPLSLHKQHQSTKIRPRFQRLSIVKIFPSAAVQEKKAALGGILDFQTTFQGIDREDGELKYL